MRFFFPCTFVYVCSESPFLHRGSGKQKEDSAASLQTVVSAMLIFNALRWPYIHIIHTW